MSTQKTIKLNETFASFNEFKETLKSYSDKTFQNFILNDSKYLKPKDSTIEWANLVEKFKYKYLEVYQRENSIIIYRYSKTQ